MTTVPKSDCPHMIASVSTAGIRKRFRSRESLVSCQPCTFKAFGDINEYWFCLQCGYIGCGDMSAQYGDASKHFNTPRSDSHSIVLHVEDDSKCWCFQCKTEIDALNGHMKEAVTLVKRNLRSLKPILDKKRGKAAENKPPVPVNTTTIAIPLPPPTPPPTISESGPRKKKKSFAERKASTSNSKNQNGPAGLVNIGNTCFMNSALQCLASTRLLLPKLEIFGNGKPVKMLVTQTQDEAFVTVVGHENENPKDISALKSLTVGDNNDITVIGDDIAKPLLINLEISDESMTGRLKQCFTAIRRSSFSKPSESNPSGEGCSYSGWQTSFNPAAVQNLLVKNFRRGQQHDSHELLRNILDMMKKDQTKAFRKSIMEHYGIEHGGEGADPNLVELVKSLDQKVKHKTFVDEIFGGELMTTQKCLTCNFVKRSHEQFLDLSLPIRVIKHNENEPEPKPTFRKFSMFDQPHHSIVINKTLNDCLRCFTEPELMTGSNEVECENCHKIKLAAAEAEENENEFVLICPETELGDQITLGIENENPSEDFTGDNIMAALEDLALEAPEREPEGTGGSSSDTDFDLPPAVDGIGGSASEDEDEKPNGISLDLPTYDKFESYHLQPADNHIDRDFATEIKKPATADDEGFSEGENSTAVENETQPGISNGPSEASSRNSISDPDENLKSSLNSDERENEKSDVEEPKPKPPKVTKCPCSRQQTISCPPEFLTVHLKRFQMSLGGMPQKLGDNVSFPMLLDLTPFCSQDEVEENKKQIPTFDENGEVMYSLYGIVEHSGSINWGHYVAYVKSQSQSDGTDQWYHISDSYVEPVTAKKVQDQEAYILFYERIRGDEKLKRTKTSSLVVKEELIVPKEEEVVPATVTDSSDLWANWDNSNGNTGQSVSDAGWDYAVSTEPEPTE